MAFLSAYYFRAHMYTIVPRQIREDMEWMAGVGTNAVVLGVLEQDLLSAVENIEIVAREAERCGMQVFATPSRWGSLVAGCPKVPSIFSCRHPEAVALKEDGSPWMSFGPVASVHHPATFEFFCSSLETLFSLAPIRGLVWDEPKALQQRDYSPAAREALRGRDLDDPRVQVDSQALFFDKVSAVAKELNPELRVAMFIYGHLQGYPVERCAQIESLQDFGLDGRPFRLADRGSNDSSPGLAGKTLCDHGPGFIEAAHRNHKNAFMLIENHALNDRDIDLMDRRLPEVLALGAEHLCYYYYPRSVSDPDRAMEVLARHLGKRK